MSTTVKAGQFSGGSALAPGSSADDLAKILRSMIDDMNALRTAHNALIAKLDLDAGVTDANYTALTAVPALTTIKG